MAHTPYVRPLAAFTTSGGVVAPGALKAEINGPGNIVPQALSVAVSPTDATVTFTGPMSAPEEAIFDAVVAAHRGVEISADEVIKTAPQKPRNKEHWFHSPNWCDPTTWWQRSHRVTGQTLQNTDNGKRIVYTAPHDQLIDLVHGKIPMEDRIAAPYRMKVFVDGELKRENKPLDAEGLKYDYDVDYNAGRVIFNEPLQPGAVVTADYSWTKSSTFTMASVPGKLVVINAAEADFTEDYVIKDTIRYQVFVPAAVLMAAYPQDFPTIQALQDFLLSSPVYAPEDDPPDPDEHTGTIESLNEFLGNVDSDGNGLSDPINLATKVPWDALDPDQREDRVYKTYWDFKYQSNGNYPRIPAVGGPMRGETSGSLTHPFGYLTAKVIRSDIGAEIRIWLEQHRAFGGSRATATFYCDLEDA